MYMNWMEVFHHPRSDLVYNIAIGSRSGYTDLYYKMDAAVPNIVIDIDNSVKVMYVVIRAIADNGQFAVYNAHETRK